MKSPRRATTRVATLAEAPAKVPDASLLQFRFDAPPPSRAEEAQKHPERAPSIKDAIIRWLDEQL